MGMFSKDKAPPPPDYTPLVNMMKEQSAEAGALSREQFAWAKEQYAKDRELAGKVSDRALSIQEENMANARKDRARYEGTFQPLEDELVRDAQSYASQERKDVEMGRAQAGVAQNFEAARDSAKRELESFGVNPAATRFAALDIGARAQQAAAAAAAGNQAAERTDALGRALRSEALNIGRGYPGQVAGTTNTALQAGGQGVNSVLSATASGANTMGTGTQWGALGQSAARGAGELMNTGYKNSLDAAKFDQESSSGIGTLLGGALGLGMGFLGAPAGSVAGKLGGKMFGFAEGGDVSEEMAIPASASPSGGAAVDDVPAQINGPGGSRPAALNVGEFVMPRPAVEWYGEKFFQNLIKKAEQDRRGGAKPNVRPASGGANQPSALPLG